MIELKINGVPVTKVETLEMKSTDVLFVTFEGTNVEPTMLQYLHEELKALLGHDRVMVMHRDFSLKLVSGVEKKNDD